MRDVYIAINLIWMGSVMHDLIDAIQTIGELLLGFNKLSKKYGSGGACLITILITIATLALIWGLATIFR